MSEKSEILQRYFGYTSFRTGQEELIDAQLSGRDVLGIMPTGGGKSICYQVPAMISEGITLVISPLISLMKDQVMALKGVGIPAAFINSSLTEEQIRKVYRYMAEGRYKIVYVAPERLIGEGFLWHLGKIGVSMVTVDEAHCISQWGQDFRPAYLRIAEFLNQLPERPVVSAFTATATSRVREDIIRLLGLKDPLVLVTGFDRPNLRFEVRKPEKKSEELLELVLERKEKSGIVYCSTRKEVEKVCEALRRKGISATRYHAGLEDAERIANQEDFVYDRSTVMVATNAFGMGIDKSNVGYVIHYNMPQSVEAYYQEAGRAGRDGSDAECVLLYAARDIQTAKFLITHPGEQETLSPEEQRVVMEKDLARLRQMVEYCNTEKCLRGYMMDYFGQSHPCRCGNCGNCDENLVKTDITAQAQMILSCVIRVGRLLGYYVGPAIIVRILRGGKDKKLKEAGLDKLPTYGLMRGYSRTEVHEMIGALEAKGYLKTHPRHGSISPTEKANGVLTGQEQVEMTVRKRAEKAGEDRKTKPAESVGTVDRALFERLRVLRAKLAGEENLPAFMVFANATLEDMSARKPQTMADMMKVKGVGTNKAKKYGEAFLLEISRYTAEQAGK